MRIPTQLTVMAGLFGVAYAVMTAAPVSARWQPEYANSDHNIQAWYKSQHNSQGQWCCDESDGHPYFGAYTLNKDGSITLDLKSGKRTIPAFMVLSGPNPTGHAVWWYVETGDLHADFCFAPGTLT
ncbi:MAG: hypothetical protein WCA36_12595 [Pseudolabrys sp.]